jgi:hypothetical protein
MVFCAVGADLFPVFVVLPSIKRNVAQFCAHHDAGVVVLVGLGHFFKSFCEGQNGFAGAVFSADELSVICDGGPVDVFAKLFSLIDSLAWPNHQGFEAAHSNLSKHGQPYLFLFMGEQRPICEAAKPPHVYADA